MQIHTTQRLVDHEAELERVEELSMQAIIDPPDYDRETILHPLDIGHIVINARLRVAFISNPK